MVDSKKRLRAPKKAKKARRDAEDDVADTDALFHEDAAPESQAGAAGDGESDEEDKETVAQKKLRLGVLLCRRPGL